MRRQHLLVLLLLLLMIPCAAMAEESFSITLAEKGKVVGFSDNLITVTAPDAGLLTLTVSDKWGVYRTLNTYVPAGVSTVRWDGLGENEERLQTGAYTMSATLSAGQGRTWQTEQSFTAAKCSQALLLALPSCDTLYLADKNDWFCEVHLVRSGKLTMEVTAADEPGVILGTKTKSIGAMVTKYKWDGTLNGKALAAGKYVLRFYASSNPAYVREVAVNVAEGSAPVLQPFVTGPVMPTRGMTDEQIWQIMMQPSVVADILQTNHLTVRSQPASNGKALGTLHGSSQAMEVFELRDGWARVGAWNHESGEYVEGWVQQSKLKVVAPSSEYGLLIDKEAQTLTLFHRGERVETLPISTGLVAKNKLIRETAAGAFLTVDRVEDFSSGGFHYDYPIRYDGGNLLHQLGYKSNGGKKDFSVQEPQLGSKASHACIRIQRNKSGQGMNAYWLYTHLPYHTRVIILDDPETRRLQAAAVGGKVTLPRGKPTAASPAEADETELVVTLGGDVVLGTREYWWDAPDGLPAYLAEYGLAYPFARIQEVFAADDMTLVNLECVLKSDKRGEDTEKQWRFRGLPEYARALVLGSVEQVNIANNHYIDYGNAGKEETQQALTAAGIPFSGYGFTYVWERDGHKIGFAGCRETTYKRDKEVINRDIAALRQAGCEVILYTCHWGTEYAATHNDLQEEMAAAAAAAGADIVIGGHPHVVQGVDCIGQTVVLYSLGNLMFGGTHELTTFNGLLAQVRLRFRGEQYVGCVLTLIPVLTSGRAAEGLNDFCPVLAAGEDRTRILSLVQADTPFALAEEMYFPAQ